MLKCHSPFHRWPSETGGPAAPPWRSMKNQSPIAADGAAASASQPVERGEKIIRASSASPQETTWQP